MKIHPLYTGLLLTSGMLSALASAELPNIVIILADDVGFSDIGAYGGEIRTPALDNLADKGKKFTQFYNTARCCPSRASLLTGLYPHQAGIGHLIHDTPHPGYGDYLAADSITVAEVLKDAGYRTYMSGKWHLAPRTYNAETDAQHWPAQRGFDKFYGTIAGSGSFYDPSTLCRMETFITPENDPEYQPEGQFYYTDAITDNARMFLQQHQTESADKPFFLYLAYTAAHWPLHAPEESIEPYRGRYDAGYEAIHHERAQRLSKMDLLPETGTIADPVGKWSEVEYKRAEASLMEAYAAMITHMDDGIAKIIQELKDSGHFENTLILFMQDNGACAEDWFSDPTSLPEPIQPMASDELQTRWGPPMQTRDGRLVRTGPDIIAGPADTYTGYKTNWANVSNTPFRWYKHYIHEGGISTPLIAHWPARIAANSDNKIIREPAHLIDVMSTILDITGIQYPRQRKGVRLQPLSGVSLMPVLTDSGQLHRTEPLYWEHESNRAIRDGKWKLVALENQPWELYDMDTDRGEMNNIAHAHPEIVTNLAAKWDAWAAASRVLPLGGWRGRHDDPDPNTFPTTVHLKPNDRLPAEKSPWVSGGGVHITADIIDAPGDGVIVSQGASAHGYVLYIENNTITFAVRRNRDLYQLNSGQLPAPPFTVKASLGKDGMPHMNIGNQHVTDKYWGPFVIQPAAGITAGNDPKGVGRNTSNLPQTLKTGSVVINSLQ